MRDVFLHLGVPFAPRPRLSTGCAIKLKKHVEHFHGIIISVLSRIGVFPIDFDTWHGPLGWEWYRLVVMNSSHHPSEALWTVPAMTCGCPLSGKVPLCQAISFITREER